MPHWRDTHVDTSGTRASFLHGRLTACKEQEVIGPKEPLARRIAGYHPSL